MRVTRPTLHAHRRAILDAAGALFRSRGIADVSVAEITRAAGLTHGAFYGHYASKAALAGAACADTLERGTVAWRARAAAARAEGRDGLAAIVAAYLTEQHRDTPASGCAIALLGAELSRSDPPLHAALAKGVEDLAAVLAEEVALRRPQSQPDVSGKAALAVLAAMVGGMTLARSLAADPQRSRAALDAARGAALAAAET